MPTPFLLDTNAYARFFQNPKTGTLEKMEVLQRMLQKIEAGTTKSFYISEITSMEIHSVLGKFRRGQKQPPQKCTREIILNDGICTKCDHMWFSRDNATLSVKRFHDMQKLISDIEKQEGDIHATILALDSLCIEEAKKLLKRYADIYDFGSQDALIAGSLLAKKREGLNLTPITSDRALLNVFKAEGIIGYDPLTL